VGFPPVVEKRPVEPPQPWQLALDDGSGKWYYHNSVTGATSWEAPRQPPPPPTSAPPPLGKEYAADPAIKALTAKIVKIKSEAAEVDEEISKIEEKSKSKPPPPSIPDAAVKDIAKNLTMASGLF